ncbi:YbdK family carboxylate-amine ligase [Methylobacterium nonmethylotrophicum]|uniref:Putative glutamate--cysteine ligase 2 n=1 Tax=Methylobacterium nonmethylotrophicum TaxID=1141884 RepID=A0A4Z0NXG0_9HYPH|nr:YbdK family carboxylate-amine ligase [Methylobacterium nonmethylotrophicum]TGE02628.1 YbdK family carboxylate-amine ligase [Methylobacterium nonmethylotrophicum]
MRADFDVCIEEEVFINDAGKRDAARARTHDFLAACRADHPQVRTELMEPQLVWATAPVTDLAEARRTLSALRSGVGALAAARGLALMASGTHPLAQWSRVRPRDQVARGRVLRDLQMVGSRTVVCGLSVAVGVPEGVSRIDLMNRVQPFLPLLLALSTSSPFWQAQRTGLLGYRLAAARELPRSGLPPLFRDEADYARYLDTVVGTGAIDDPRHVWWVICPSPAGPSLDLRIADSCTRLDDALAIAALYRCLVRRLARDPGLHRDPTGASHAIAAENCWRAQRYGIHGSFVCEATRAARPVATVLGETLALVAEDARALACEAELDLARWIVARGTSADRQLALFTEAQGRGLPPREALAEVVDWLTAETVGANPTRH